MAIDSSRMKRFDVIILTITLDEWRKNRKYGNVIKNEHWSLADQQVAINSTLMSSGFCYHD